MKFDNCHQIKLLFQLLLNILKILYQFVDEHVDFEKNVMIQMEIDGMIAVSLLTIGFNHLGQVVQQILLGDHIDHVQLIVDEVHKLDNVLIHREHKMLSMFVVDEMDKLLMIVSVDEKRKNQHYLNHVLNLVRDQVHKVVILKVVPIDDELVLLMKILCEVEAGDVELVLPIH